MKEFYIKNREKLARRLADNSAAAVFSGRDIKKMGDENYPFTPQSNFFYLTGIDEPEGILLIVKKNGDVSESLFIEPPDDEKAQWVGAVISKEKAAEISGIENIYYNYTFYEKLSDTLFNKRIENIYIDLENRDFRMTRELEFAKDTAENYPYIDMKDLHIEMAELRRIKSRQEIENIGRAIEITGEGIVNMMKNARAGMYEYEIEAYFDFALKYRSVKDFAFKSIVASGKNATVLHYSRNCDKTGDGDLVLCDVGAKYNYYCGDITRTFPVNGRFTDRQKQLYNIVLDGQKLILKTIRPGVPFKSLNETLLGYYAEKLKEIGLISTEKEVKKYYWHNVSHMLGIETHDVGRHNEGLLEEGMVLTVEPGLYIADEGIGIRIEDDVVVTKDGCRLVYDGIPKEISEIEAIMAGGKNG